MLARPPGAGQEASAWPRGDEAQVWKGHCVIMIIMSGCYLSKVVLC